MVSMCAWLGLTFIVAGYVQVRIDVVAQLLHLDHINISLLGRQNPAYV